ncbi:MAG: class I SAM-dependent methyltransferase [Halobacteria archaeon]
MKGRDWYQEGETATEYDEWRFSKGGELVDEGEKKALFDITGDLNGVRLLETACGTGRFTIEFLERNAEVTGVDISRPMLEEARKKISSTGFGGSVDFLRGDGKNLPFPDDSFEVAVAMRFFHLADEPAEYLKELQRVSKNYVVFDTFSKSSARRTYNSFLPMGSNLYTDDDVHGFVDKADLKVVDSKKDFFFPFGLYRVTPKKLAKGVRKVDRKMQDVVGDGLCTVQYWKVK